MALTHLKTASKTPETESGNAQAVVSDTLAHIKAEGDDAVRHNARALDTWDGPIGVTREEMEARAGVVPEQVHEDIAFAAGAVRRLALAQMASISEFELTMGSGPRVVQKMILCNVAGCDVPTGRHGHVASACMSVATVAGVDIVMTLGGVQAIAAVEAHARTAYARMTKSYPGHNFGLGRPVETVA
jgi:sulfopropanediol 3-dehydrogenase